MNWLIWAALALAAPEDALDEATRPFFLRAVSEADAGRPSSAAAFYRLVLGKDPGFVPASLGLGRALEATGARTDAEAVYRSLGADADAVEALARLVESRDPGEALSLWRRLETLRYGDPIPYREEARLLASSDPEAALSAFSTYKDQLLGGEPDAATVLSVGAGLMDMGRTEAGEAIWRAHLEAWPACATADELRARLDRLDVERAAEAVSLGGSEPVPPALVPRYAAAQRAMAEGNLDGAEQEGRAVVAAAPRSAEAHGLLSDVFVARRRWDQAEIHAMLARVLAPDDASTHVRLGMLLAAAYGGRRDGEAVEELREAALLRPADGELRVALARLEQRVGNQDRALAAYQRYLAATPSGPAADDARAQVEALQREPPQAPGLPAPARVPLAPEAERHYRRSIVLAKWGRTPEALVQLEAALALAPTATVLLNNRARFARGAADPAEAEAWLVRSLAADPNQAPVILELAGLARARGDTARAEELYAEAAKKGLADAHFLLARLAEERGDWGLAGIALSAYEAGAPGSGSLNQVAAGALRERLTRRSWAVRVVGAAAALLSLGVPFGLWVRYRTARTLRDLLDGAPECWHEAARLLAALQHEVLKHNTTVLPDVADALARGDTGPWVAFAARAPALLQHFRSYLGQLEVLGQRHGLRLGLRRRDPILGPMHRALTRLAGARRPPRPEELRTLSDAINGAGYGAIGQIVREICVLPVTVAGVREVYARVVREPGFAMTSRSGGATLPELAVTEREGGGAVRMFRSDLEDILANLLRNALGAGAAHVGVELGPYDDPITGHAWMEVAVLDDAPGTLTNAMIRGRYIGRGLGLAVDLINRHGGSIRVETRGEGKKAVIVQLPSVEAAPVEVEEWTVS